MTGLGSLALALAGLVFASWILDRVRRGRLYVGYGVVMLGLVSSIVVVCVVPMIRRTALAFLGRLFPSEPVAVVGLGAVLLLLVYLLEQIAVLSDRVATLTQELAMRGGSPDTPPQDSRREAGR